MKPVADISVVIPAVRKGFINVVLRAFELGDVLPSEVVLVSNEIARVDVQPRDFPIRILKFNSDEYVCGFHDIALRRNVGVWEAWSGCVLCFDDDEVPMANVLSVMQEKLKTEPYIWGHHRFTDFDEPSGAEEAEVLIARLQSMPAESGRSREHPANFEHQYLSGYGGMLAASRRLLMMLGGFDMIHNGDHGEDQALARQLSHFIGRGDGIFIHEPPFAWCSNKYFPIPDLETNVCKDHQHTFSAQTLGGVPLHQCSKCPYRVVPNLHPSPTIRMPFNRQSVSVFAI